MVDCTTLEVAGVLFAATLIRSTLGFGEALVAVPLLALVIPVEVAAPVAAMVSVTVALVVLVEDWRHVDLRAARGLVLATLLGIPFGVIALRTVDEPIVKIVLGATILAFALYALIGPRGHALADDRWSWLFGLGAGVLGGAYGMNGPPLVVYGSLRGWSPARFTATLQGYFLPASLLGLVGFGIAGLWTPAVGHDYVMSLPAIALAIVLGRRIFRRLDAARFRAYVHVALAAIGVLLVVEALLRG